MPLRLTTYHQGDPLPALPGRTVFHSSELFHVYEQTRGYLPILIVAYEGDRPLAKLLAVIRRSVRLFPPALIRRCEVYGSGEYFDDTVDREALFGEMLEHLTREALSSSFLIEFRNLENPLFGYRFFRRNGYFPLSWLRVYNSLHSRTPQERLSASRRKQIARAQRGGACIAVARTEQEVDGFARMLGLAYSSQVRKHFPDLNFFRQLVCRSTEKEMARIFLVKYKDKIIGGSVCVYSDTTAYLWFSGGMRKTYAWLYPGVLAVWAAITDAYDRGYAHFEFMDAGLPFKPYGYRDFILRFGGKQVSTRRWFHLRWQWLNRLLSKIYL